MDLQLAEKPPHRPGNSIDRGVLEKLEARLGGCTRGSGSASRTSAKAECSVKASIFFIPKTGS